jgi:hypothetical protein
MTPTIPKGSYLYGLKHQNGEYRHAIGANTAEAAASIGWTVAEVKRAMPLKSGDIQTAKRASLEKFLKSKEADDPEKHLRDLLNTKGVSKEKQDEIIAEATAKAQPGAWVGPFQIPPVEQTEAGAQYVAPEMIGRKIPAGKIQARRQQSAAPLELEAHATQAQQGRLF